MDCRIFGKELTNIVQAENRNRKSYSYIHGDKLKEHNNNVYRAIIPVRNNRSFTLKEEKETNSSRLQTNNSQMVPEYFHQNIRFLRKKEKETYSLGNYLMTHPTISEQERAKLVDWVAKLHYKYKMFPQTLFTVVSLIDQYLKVKEVPLYQLQLVGIACLFIAAKFEQTYQVPPLKQLVTSCANQYSASQILQKQADIVKQLNFNLIINSSFKFFQPYVKVIGLERKNEHLAHYVLQLSLLQPKFLIYAPSLIAASAIYLIKKIRKSQSSWNSSMMAIVGYQQRQLKICAKQLCTLLECAPDLENCKSIKEKFSLPSYHEVTRIKLQRKQKK